MVFPPGITTIQVTGQELETLDGTPLNGVVVFSASGPISDPAVSTVLEGSALAQVVNGVMTTLLLPTTDCVSPGFTYTITLRLQGPDKDPPPYPGVVIPHTLGASVDISALLA